MFRYESRNNYPVDLPNGVGKAKNACKSLFLLSTISSKSFFTMDNIWTKTKKKNEAESKICLG